jgi:hypothetical protein
LRFTAFGPGQWDPWVLLKHTRDCTLGGDLQLAWDWGTLDAGRRVHGGDLLPLKVLYI